MGGKEREFYLLTSSALTTARTLKISIPVSYTYIFNDVAAVSAVSV